MNKIVEAITGASGGGMFIATRECISEALDHLDLKTTKNYFAGFEDETRRVITERLMKFLSIRCT